MERNFGNILETNQYDMLDGRWKRNGLNSGIKNFRISDIQNIQEGSSITEKAQNHFVSGVRVT